jgi:hypothetical protein
MHWIAAGNPRMLRFTVAAMPLAQCVSLQGDKTIEILGEGLRKFALNLVILLFYI